MKIVNKTLKILIVVISIILLILILLLIANAIMYLFIPEKSHHNYSGILTAKYGDAYSKENIYGDSVEIELDFNTTRIYNTLYYEGYVIIENERYKLKGELFKPYSMFGKLHSSIVHMGNMEPDYRDHFLEIVDFPNYDDAHIYYSEHTGYVSLSIRKNEIDYDWYEYETFE